MENKRLRFGYEDTDKKIEIDLYGLIFEINKEKIVDKDINNIDERNENEVENEIKELIGEDSIERINNKRKNDGYEKMTLDVEVAVLTCIYKAYITATSGTMIDEIINTNKEIEEKVKNNAINREQRRTYNKNRRRNYRHYRRY